MTGGNQKPVPKVGDGVIRALGELEGVSTFQSDGDANRAKAKEEEECCYYWKKFRWPNAVIPYEFKDNNTEWKKLIWRGMKQWQKETCIRFVERTNETDYAVFFKGGGYGNFEKRSDIMNSEIPYDFGSVMHYAPQAFTKDWKLVTVETKISAQRSYGVKMEAMKILETATDANAHPGLVDLVVNE
ncbi:astacin [Teladorsagia circumcincta]|uniref:Astacin n=1 Tax=Teladorsagia circumcincta TaxID=45464 RepID=A0A2G9UTZ5_TELCI|nr:astacin [Teladorsagia circumcincta]